MIIRRRFLLLVAVAAGIAIAVYLRWDWVVARVTIWLMESESRIALMQVERVVDTLGISRGQRIADIGAGSGLFTLPLARRAGEKGVVYAVDINARLLDHIRTESARQGIESVRPILGSESDPNIPEPVDLIFICDMLHHIEDRPSYLKNLRPHLKAGGRVAIIDFSEKWPPGHGSMKYSRNETRRVDAGRRMDSGRKLQLHRKQFFRDLPLVGAGRPTAPFVQQIVSIWVASGSREHQVPSGGQDVP